MKLLMLATLACAVGFASEAQNTRATVPPQSPDNRIVTQPQTTSPAGAAIGNRRTIPNAAAQFAQPAVTNAGLDPLTRSNNFASGNFGMADVQGLILDLQNTIDQALPVVARLTAGNAGIDPTTGLPRQLVNTAVTGQTPPGYVGNAGTNTVRLDPHTYQSLIVLQNHLQQTRLALRDLNASERLAVPQNSQQLAPTGVQNPAAPQAVNPQNRLQPTPVRPAVPPQPRQRILHPAGQ